MSTLIRKFSILALTFSLSTCYTAPAFADDTVKIYGPGAIYCHTALKHKAEDIPPVVYWLQGYISAKNIELNKQEGRPFDPMPEEFKFQEQVTFLFNFCQQNPEKDISDAAEAMVQRLKTMDALRGTVLPGAK